MRVTLIADVQGLRDEQAKLAEIVSVQAKTIARQEEQINGERGLSAAITTQTAEIRGLRKAAYWVAGLIVAGSVTMAFSALQLVGGH
jgi:hypothetical protein